MLRLATASLLALPPRDNQRKWQIQAARGWRILDAMVDVAGERWEGRGDGVDDMVSDIDIGESVGLTYSRFCLFCSVIYDYFSRKIFS